MRYLLLLFGYPNSRLEKQFAHDISFVLIQMTSIIQFMLKCDKIDSKGERSRSG